MQKNIWPSNINDIFQIDDDMFLKIQEAFQADIYQSLCDSDTPPNSSKKRIRKSVERSLSFLEKIMENRSKNEVMLHDVESWKSKKRLTLKLQHIFFSLNVIPFFNVVHFKWNIFGMKQI